MSRVEFVEVRLAINVEAVEGGSKSRGDHSHYHSPLSLLLFSCLFFDDGGAEARRALVPALHFALVITEFLHLTSLFLHVQHSHRSWMRT